ncbi:MAG: hypothetical protein FJ335_12875 [Sphingomonadales bacterium]|nr:hypothetical protein [Sphingomonadales bacterium]
MPAARAAIQPAPRKTLLEWIDHDDGNTPVSTAPVCSDDLQTLHARLVVPTSHEGRGQREALEPPPGLRLAPLG